MSQLLKISSKSLIVLLLIVFSLPGSAETYYVDCNLGNDNNLGRSIDSPWKSIGKVNKFEFLPGDSILFKNECTWFESLKIGSSGTLEKPIIFSYYGDDSKRHPTLNGTVKEKFLINAEVPPFLSAQIYINNHLYQAKCNRVNNTILSTYLNNSTYIPDTIEIEYLKLSRGITVTGNYIEINKIKVEKFKNVGIKIFGKNVKVSNSIIENIPKTGLQFILSDSSSVLNTKFFNIGFDSNPCCQGYECGHLGNGVFIALEKNKDASINAFTNKILIANCIFENIGTFSGDHGVYDNGHNTAFINNTFENCSGTGIKLDGENAFVLNNTFDSCITAGILIDGGQGHEIIHNEFYGSGMISKDWGQQGAIWYVEQTKQTNKHPNQGGATIKFNKIVGGNVGLKISNSFNSLNSEANLFQKQHIYVTNMQSPILPNPTKKDYVNNFDSLKDVNREFKSVLFPLYNEKILQPFGEKVSVGNVRLDDFYFFKE